MRSHRTGRSPSAADDSTPELVVVVDTEEEFDWSRPFSRQATATTSIAAQSGAHRVFDRFGVVPTYVVDYPVATAPEAASVLRALRDAGQAEIGAHLHPWVTPPHDEAVTARNSYHCNLPPALERAKIEALTESLERAFGERPIIFKAGRYGFGPNTMTVLKDLGYRIDCSFVPYTSFRPDGGPDFRHAPAEPWWLDEEAGLLEVPLTVGFAGGAARLGPLLRSVFDSPGARRLHIPGILARTGLVSRGKLSPEGYPAAEQCRLIDSLLAQGRRTFSLTYHSPSLAPGHTPYVRTPADLERFLASIEAVLAHFQAAGGRFTTLSKLYACKAAGRMPRAA